MASLTADGGERGPILPGWTLRVCLCRLAKQLSADLRVLYVASQTFGGPGTQEGVGWLEDEMAYGPSGTCDLPVDLVDGYRVAPRADSAINVGLRFMGVHASDDFDEFAAAGLSAHRFTSDWLIG